MNRKSKYLRLNYLKSPERKGAFVALFDTPNEVRIGVSDLTFLSMREDGLTLSPGLGGSLNLQTLPGGNKYAGMISETPFPLSMLPSTMATPIPSHIFKPPFQEILKDLKEMNTVLSAFVGL